LIPLHDDNPTRSTPILTFLLVAVNVVVWLVQLRLGDRFTYQYALFPAAVVQGRQLVADGIALPALEPTWLSIFTSMFLHGSWLHLIGNMWYLWIFGNNVEDALGRARFVFFYLFGGAVAAAAHIVTGPNSTIPTVGASGAIAAVLGGYLVLYPHARITTVVPIFFFLQILQLPASIVLGFWFLLQIFNGLMGMGMMEDRGGVAFMAHVGGFVAGYIVMRLFGNRRREPPRYERPRFMDY
jgi:membrane associated rhomboid family serine protease